MTPLAEWLVAARKAKNNLSQAELAEAIKVSVRTVSGIEADGRIPNRNTLMRIAEHFGFLPQTFVDLVRSGQRIPPVAEPVRPQRVVLSEELSQRIRSMARGENEEGWLWDLLRYLQEIELNRGQDHDRLRRLMGVYATPAHGEREAAATQLPGDPKRKKKK